MKRVVLIHGWVGSPDSDWLPWLGKELVRNGIEVIAPMMPNPAAPEIESWVSKIEAVVGSPKEDLLFVGHSVGCQAILRYLERIKTKVYGVVLVAPWFSLPAEALEDEGDRLIAEPWLKTPIDFQKVKNAAKKFVAIFSDNDPWVALPENSDVVKKKLNAKVFVEHEKGHFSEEIGGVTEIPIVLREILKMAKKSIINP